MTMHIEAIMSTPAVTCRINDSLNTAAQRMWDNDCGALPVVDEDGALVGMVTDRDVCMAAYTRGAPLHAISVSEAMASKVVSCHPDDSLQEVERLMGKHQIRRVPVLDDDGRLAGVLSLNDIARAAASASRKNGAHREVVQTLAAICAPRARRSQQASQPTLRTESPRTM